jgi:hypothetical protein
MGGAINHVAKFKKVRVNQSFLGGYLDAFPYFVKLSSLYRVLWR